MNDVKTYILAPNFDIPADGPNALKLGHIISDPMTPNIALNKSQVVPFPKDLIPSSTKKSGWTGTISQLRAKKFGLWARFLEIFGLGGEVSVHSNSGNENYFTLDSLETTFIDPGEEYVKQSMSAEGVQRFIKASRYNKPVYMITGLKIANGASAIGSETVVRGGQAKFGFDGTSSGVPVSVGSEAEISSTKINTVSFDGASPFPFAIRLRQISYDKGKEIVQQEYRVGVVLGTDKEEGDEEQTEDVKVLGLNAQDAEDFQGLVSDKPMKEEEDEGEAQYIVLKKMNQAI